MTRRCFSRRTLLALLVSASVVGCAGTVAPPSAVPKATARHATTLPAAEALGLRSGVPSRSWWRAMGDERLNTLVSQAMASNHERLAALAAVRQARALAGLAERAGLPQGGVSAQAQVQRPSVAEVDPYDQQLPRPPSQRLGTIAQMASWEIDLFGRVGTAAAVAERQAEAAEADVHGTEALLQAEVVRHYVLLRLAQQDTARLDVERQALDQRSRLMQAREQAGLADRREALAARAELAQVHALLGAAQASEQRERAALAVLTGRSAATTDAAWAALMSPGPMPTVPERTELVAPSDLLARRPDIVRADAQLRAALGETVLAERAHLPRLSLNLSLGLNAAFGALGQASALRYAAGPALQWDWLEAGRLRDRAAAARAGGEVAWHQFEQTVLTAIADSESALRTWQAAQQAWQEARTAEQAAREAAAYAQARADAGLEPPTTALEQAARHLAQQRSTIAQQADLLQAYARVQLSLAAWQPEPAALGSHAKPPTAR